MLSPSTSRRSWLLALLGVLAGLAVLLAAYHYFTGSDATLPIRAVVQLQPVPTALEPVRVGLAELPVRANGYLVTQTHDVGGPYVRAEAAYALLALLAVGLTAFLAVVSTLPRPAFVAGMAGVIFLLMSLNADLLGVFDAQQQYFLTLVLAALALPAFALHAFWPEVPLGGRVLLFAALVGGLSVLLFRRSELPFDATALHLVAFATVGGAVVVGLVVLWVAFENIHGLLWFNTQAENPGSRFGLVPFLLASLLYLGTLGLYLWNEGELLILPGVHFDPLVLLLPAAGIGWAGLRRRATSYGEWVPAAAAEPLYLVFVALAAGFLGYALATANDPLLLAARRFTAWALLAVGVAFLVYVLINFGPLIRQRLRVYRVVYEPRRLPLYAVYVLGLGAIVAAEFRFNFPTLQQVDAGYYNNLGDLTRLQSELEPTRDALALLAERYYAESDLLDQHNHKASLGRAALYRFRLQRQNEINILRRALSRQPSERISLRLAALYNEPTDFFDRLAVLREALRDQPASAPLNNDLAQLYTRSSLTDSVTWYLNRATAAAPNDAVVQANRLAFLLQPQPRAAAELVRQQPTAADAAWQSNALLLRQLHPQLELPEIRWPLPDTAAVLTPAEFARYYHGLLPQAVQGNWHHVFRLNALLRRPGNAAYADQLTLLKALMLHNAGQVVDAQKVLAPLAAGNSPSTAYYQNLGGLWLLQQGAYGAAATRLATAARNGYSEAYLNRAYALALSGQLDSARTAAGRASQDSSLRQPARELQRVLNLNFNTEYAAAPKAVQAQYLVLRGQFLYPESLIAYASRLRDTTARQAALLAQVPRALQAGQLVAARAALRFAPLPRQRSAATSAWNVVRGQVYIQGKDADALRSLLSEGYLEPTAQPHHRRWEAALAELENRTGQANKAYAVLVEEAPYLEDAMLAAAEFYARQRDYLAGYGALQAALEYNPESVPLLKAYALAAVPAGLTEYAAASLARLRALLSPAEYATFLTLYNARRATQAAAAAPWN